MPYIAIKAYPKDDAVKRRIVERINQIFQEEWGCPPQAISISLEEVAPDAWDELVRKREIEPNQSKMLILDGQRKYQTEEQTMEKQSKALRMTDEWDKIFPKSAQVEHCKTNFENRFGIPLAADVYRPKGATGSLAAIAVCGPYGAVKEQSSGLYAQELARRGFLSVAFDPSFTGESGGAVRETSSPEINTEDFSAAIDYLVSRNDVDAERIGICGICGWGGVSLSAAAQDTRVKATVSSTMGSFDDFTPEQRIAARREINALRTRIARGEQLPNGKTVPNPCPADAPDFIRDYHDFYCTERGYHPRSVNSGLGWTPLNWIGYYTFPLFGHAGEIESAVLLVHGEKAYSRYASEKAFSLLKGGNKRLLIVPGASHTDLYDRMDFIPFDDIEAFYRKHLG